MPLRLATARLPLLALLTAAWAGCGDDGEQAGGPPPGERAVQVRTATVEREPVVYYQSYPGTVRPLEEVEVRPQVSGSITAVHHVEGQPVRRGERLYTIDTRQYAAAAESASADVESARAQLALAEKDVNRYRRLAEADAIATQTLDQAETQLEAARQSVESAEARQRQAETQLDYAVVRAPISGTTGLNSAKVGTQVSPGQPLLVTIAQLEPIGVDFAAPQELIPRLKRVERSPADFPDSLFRLRLPNDSLYGVAGEIYALDQAVDAATGTLRARLRFPNDEGLLVPGMNLEVEVLDADAGPAVTVPTTALADQMGERYVYLVRDSLALRQKVTTGYSFRDRTVITDGLRGGELIASAGLNMLRDSAKVRPLPRQTASTPAPDRASAPAER